MFKFIHCADIHLDSPLRGLKQYEGAPVDEIRGATRGALENLVTLAIERTVDFVIIAGDLFDGSWSDPNTGFAFTRQMSRLRAEGIDVFLSRGNHDAQSKMGRSLRLPDNVVLLSHKKAETISHPVLDRLGVAIHGRSFAKQAETSNLATDYPDAIEGRFNIGILHTSLTGREGHDNYAPCSIDDLAIKNYDYWALGHVHQREICHDEPLVVYPGNIQGRHIRETGEKGCFVVSVGDDRKVDMEFVATDVFRWAVCRVEVAGANSPDEVIDQFSVELQGIVDENQPHSVAIRIELTGQSELHQDFLANSTRWHQEFQARAIEVAFDKVWIEKLKVYTEPGNSSESPKALSAAIAEFEEYFEELKGDRYELEQWRHAIEPLLKKLPDSIVQEIEHFDVLAGDQSIETSAGSEQQKRLFESSSGHSAMQGDTHFEMIQVIKSVLMQEILEHQQS